MHCIQIYYLLGLNFIHIFYSIGFNQLSPKIKNEREIFKKKGKGREGTEREVKVEGRGGKMEGGMKGRKQDMVKLKKFW